MRKLTRTPLNEANNIDSSLREYLLANFGATDFFIDKCYEGLSTMFHKFNRSLLVTLESTYIGLFHVYNEFFKVDTSKKSIIRIPEGSLEDALKQINLDALNWSWATTKASVNMELDIEAQQQNLQLVLDKYRSILSSFQEAVTSN